MSIKEKLEIITDKVYEKGQERIWECITSGGTRTNYSRAFNNQNFDGVTLPQNLVVKDNSPQMFYAYTGEKLPLGVDLSKVPKGTSESGCTSYSLFSWSINLTHIYDVKLPVQIAYGATFSTCRKLKTIEKIRVDEDCTFSNTFYNCDSLTDVTFEGTIGKSINFKQSPLSVKCMKHIISCLKNYSGTSDAMKYTLTFNSDCWYRLNASGLPDGFNAWQVYVNSLGWIDGTT
jgi:hypothetical protein